ncbi:DnaA regulatory inactivator Hda [Gammaproteobacteria bacterium AB-CW1]|uniref:DnaA regulatory inactivator Hda n=1 Tax=Natronospira elongata TaxID=3110268 RepID=A0AAP6JDX5_9GAMM|nr:DnaA regulatory inactivator Hda [Gammaproteobacteria bacterium AB-CW1]
MVDGLALGGGQLPLGIELSLETRLDDFLPGPNAEALATANALAEGRWQSNLYLAGASATGKTHLLQGVSHAASAMGRQVAYLPLSRPEMRDPELLAGWAGFDVVCLDDLQSVAGEMAWERALFRLYEDMREAGGQLVFAADEPPASLDLCLPDLASRLAAGPVYRLEPLDDDDLGEALRLRLARRGLSLPDDSARWLMRRVRRDMHSLTRLADRLDHLSLTAQRGLTIPFLRQVLDDT